MWPFKRKREPWYGKYLYGKYINVGDVEYLQNFKTEEEFMEGVPYELLCLPYKIYITDVVNWRKIEESTGAWPTYQQLYRKSEYFLKEEAKRIKQEQELDRLVDKVAERLKKKEAPDEQL